MDFMLEFPKICLAVIEIFFISLLGFIFFKLKLISIELVNELSRLVINLFLPCLIFSHLLKNPSFITIGDWWVYPLLGIGVSLIGFFVAQIILFFDKNSQAKKELVSLIAFQNCGYLPLVLIAEVFPPALSQALFVYIFLFIQGFNFIFFSYGIEFLGGGEFKQKKIKDFLNLPFLSLLLSLGFLISRFYIFVPKIIIQATALIGDCTLPIALLALGAVLANCPLSLKKDKRFFFEVVLGKLVIMPALALLFLFRFKIPPYMALVILMESAMPSAVNLSVVSYYKKSEGSLISQAVFLTHLLSIFTIPFFLGLAVHILKTDILF